VVNGLTLTSTKGFLNDSRFRANRNRNLLSSQISNNKRGLCGTNLAERISNKNKGATEV